MSCSLECNVEVTNFSLFPEIPQAENVTFAQSLTLRCTGRVMVPNLYAKVNDSQGQPHPLPCHNQCDGTIRSMLGKLPSILQIPVVTIFLNIFPTTINFCVGLLVYYFGRELQSMSTKN